MTAVTPAGGALESDPNAWRLARVADVVRETHRAVTVRFDVPGWPGHRAGQRIDIRLTAEDGYTATRAYSMASPWTPPAEQPERNTAVSPASQVRAAPAVPTVPPIRGSAIDVTVEVVEDGEVSPYLVDVVQAGDELEIRGPIGGAFTWAPDDGGPVLLVAGGSGLVPLMAMARAHAAGPSDADVRVLISARTIEDILYREELERLAAAGAIGLQQTLTRTVPDGWPGGDRRVDAAMLKALGPAPSEAPTIFVCGSNAFVEAAVRALLDLGHSASSIRTERFGPSAS